MLNLIWSIFMELLYICLPFIILVLVLFSGMESQDEVDPEASEDEIYGQKIQQLKNGGGYSLLYLFGFACIIGLLLYTPIMLRVLADWLVGF